MSRNVYMRWSFYNPLIRAQQAEARRASLINDNNDNSFYVESTIQNKSHIARVVCCVDIHGNPYRPQRPFGCETKFTSGTKHHVTIKIPQRTMMQKYTVFMN